MGKVRKTKIRTPAGVDTSDSLENGFHVDSDEESNCGPIEAISIHLQRANIEEKLNGLHSFAVLALRKEKLREILESDLVRIAAPLLCDRDNAIKNAAAGALRNLSVYGPEVCEYLVENDILTALLSLITSYDLKINILESELQADTFLQAIHLLRNLTESSPTATEAFNQSLGLLKQLLLCLDYKKFGFEISIAVAQLVLVLSENNSSSWNVVANEQFLTELIKVNQEEANLNLLYLSALAAGILVNVPACSSAYTKEIMASLEKLLTTDTQAQLNYHKNALEQEVTKNQVPVLEISMETEDLNESQANGKQNGQNKQTETEEVLQNLEYLLDGQRLVAEIITNLASSDDDDDNQQGNANADSDLDQSETESVADYDMEDETVNNSSSGDFLEIIKSGNVVEKLWQKCQPLDLTLEKVLSLTHNSQLQSKFTKMRVSHLLCLQNLTNLLKVDDLGGHQNIYNMWFQLGQQAFKGITDATIMEAITSLMRSSLLLLKSRKDLFQQMTEADLVLIIEGARSCPHLDIRVNWNRMLGTLGCLLAENLVKIIIVFLLDSCKLESDLWALSEGLDALMDIFAIEDWPEIIAELNMCESVKILEETFKSKLRQQRRDMKERRATIMTVKTNFSRFVTYLNDNCKK
ncbi:uncharacterized protein Dwil_GK12176 [Drosophila willistoni]|uniref:SYO1-like TPR repeats domain-containing protein n=1 Tax=Drosophila willistoni TaxID=7260 RepID=B4N981_DROWI|nr:HEAT repeat-containing protein 3 [Drosophila willistoni]EDW81628.1 uncharacterized protein Dwil_GK12176 [Drosophila willistoni]